jgi:(1->4)-alpha-D-glucan 1-alpha-D-glucosylmutase
VRGILGDAAFCQIIEGFVGELRGAAERNAIAQLVLKLTVPGVPDTYQGNEIFRYDLTDPDNRRELDFAALGAKLRQVERANCTELLASRDPDLRKLYVTHKLLQLRRAQPEWFGAAASYQPLRSTGLHADRITSFARGMHVIVAVPRLTAGIADNWADSGIELPAGVWQNVLCGAHVQAGLAAELFAQIPAAVLVRQDV